MSESEYKSIIAGLLIAAAWTPGLRAADIAVSNATDVVNGSISSPEALLLNQGPDGISLREALLAANNAPGPHTITFTPALAGETIALASLLPTITREGVTIAGITSAGGEPAVTVDAGGSLRSGFNVWASGFTLIHMRVARVHLGGGGAVNVEAGGPQRPQVVENIRIENNVFTNVGVDDTGFGVGIGMRPGSSSAVVRNVRIATNHFLHYSGDGDAVAIGCSGVGNLLADITVENNEFSESTFPVELALSGQTNTIQRVSITGNTFERNNGLSVPIGVLGGPDEPSSGNLIEDTLVAGNTFRENKTGAVYVLGGFYGNRGNTIRGTRILNNRFVSTVGGIGLTGGTDTSAENHIEQTLISGNVFSATSSPVSLTAGSGSSRGNLISDTQILNNRFTPAAAVSVIGGNEKAMGNRVERTLISGNVAQSPPGALVSVRGGDGNAANNSITDTRIENNRVTNGDSGASIVAGSGTGIGNRVEHVVVSGNVFAGSALAGFQALTGGAAGSEITDVQLINDLITGTQTFGAVIFVPGAGNRMSQIRVVNNTIAQNPSVGINIGPVVDAQIVNTILWANTPDLRVQPGVVVRNSVIADPQFSGNGNLAGDPLFMNAAQGDYYLRPGSPAIDAGTSDGSPAKDIDGRDRGFRHDIGAYAFTGPVPPFGITAVVNAASFAPGLVPGSLATVFGRGLIPVTGVADAAILGISVTVNDRIAPVISAAKQAGLEQISIQAPFEAVPGSAVVQAENYGARFSASNVPGRISQPGIFEVPLDKGMRTAAVIHSDGGLVTPANPAIAGEIVSLFFTGGGTLLPPVATGLPGPAPPAITALPVSVGVADAGAKVLFSGYAPQALGLYQVNFAIPSGIPSGPSVKLNLKAGDEYSQSSTIAIK